MKKSQHFTPGKTYIPVSGKVYDDDEIANATSVAIEGWWTEGEYTKKFEHDFKKFLGVNYVTIVNSGSSANLVALYSLSSSIFGSRALRPGDEFITTAAGFPTTVNPGIMFGLKPVFLDVDSTSLNMDSKNLEKAITARTKLIMIAHTLGIPFDLERILYVKKKYNLWLIEDSCDALGGEYDKQKLGTFGDIATFSFYPAHQMTMGEGGAVVTNNPLIHRSIRQFRDWGRDCWCDTGKDNTCGKRFSWKLGGLPEGYDHKYIYSQIGFNLKATDFQSAIGVAQLKKLPNFIKMRKENYKNLADFFYTYPRLFNLVKLSEKADPCWFGIPVTICKEAPFTRNDLTQYLENHNIGTRNIFAGNLLKHPAYQSLKRKRISGEMKNCDELMERSFWLGVFPGITPAMIRYMKKTLTEFITPFL